MKDYLIIATLIFFAMPASMRSQSGAQKIDSPQPKSYAYFHEKIETLDDDTLQASNYIEAWIGKAKQEKNENELIRAYEEKIYFSVGNKRLVYADSALSVAMQTKNDKTIGQSLTAKGSEYYFRMNYTEALNLYIKAGEYLSRTKEEYLKTKLKYGIANIKFHLEFFDEALMLYEECVLYFKKSDDYNHKQGYLNSLYSIALCHNRMGNYGKSEEANAFAFQEAKRLEDKTLLPYLLQSQGVNEYYSKNYAVAIKNIQLAEKDIAKMDDFGAVTVGNYYIARAYWSLGETEKALGYFRKVDQAFVQRQYMRADFREGYELLANYYKSKGDVANQLHYINRLIRVDSLLNSNFKKMSGKMHKEYDSRALLVAKSRAEDELATHATTTKLLYGAVSILFFSALFFFYRYYTTKKQYQKKLDDFLKSQENVEIPEIIKPEKGVETPEKKTLEINPEVVKTVLEKLEKFETRQKFLKKDITLVELSGQFGTNSNYLSKIIQHYRDKNFARYLNDLRINYITVLMKTDTRYRNYTMRALADEAGFSTPQHFSKAFFAVHGFYPSLFLENM